MSSVYTIKRSGFTIVELLIVIVVIGILAAISVVAYSGVQERARMSKIKSDLTTLSQAIQSARITSQKSLNDITGSGNTLAACIWYQPAGTNLASLPRTDLCWVNYVSALNLISVAGGINVRNLVDPWGRPYIIDENEGELGGCLPDILAAYKQPFNLAEQYTGTSLSPPLSGFSGCAL